MTHILAYEPFKAAIAERAIREVKKKLYRAMQFEGNHNWTDYLPDVIYSLNNSKSRALDNLSPMQVTADNVPRLWHFMTQNELAKQLPVREYLFDVGQSVRLRHIKGNKFRKEYNEQTSSQVYYIHSRRAPGNNHLYKLRSDRDVVLPGSFRENDLEKVIINENTQWRIERVIGRPVIRNGVRMVKVRYLDYDSSYDEYIPEAQVGNLMAPRAPGNRRGARGRGRRGAR